MLLKLPISQERQRRRIEAERQELLNNSAAIRFRCQRLAGFVREAWHVLEPNTPLVWGWHLDALCAHLEAISRGEFNLLLVNIPPGTMKSLIVSVFWPAWEWGPLNRPSLTYLTTAYKDEISTRDARKMRDLVASEWFQHLWPHVVMTRLAETSSANAARGTRESMAFKNLTGGRGDRVIIDDPHSTESAESDLERATAIRVFRESVPSRINDPKTSAIVVIMQRLNEGDVSGTILKLGLPYVHLNLPMEFEADNRCTTRIGFTDPRTFDGELLFPERFPPEWIKQQKDVVGPYAWAGQYQQRPVPRSGGMFKRENFRIVNAAPFGTVWVRYWDLAGTAGGTGARTAGLKLGKSPDGAFYIGHVVTDRLEGAAVRRLMLATAELDGTSCEIGFSQDPGQAGKTQAADIVAMLAGYKAAAHIETGSKITRAEPASSQSEAGNIYLVRGDWNQAFLDEACVFPNAPLKDQVDALSGAFGRHVAKKGWAVGTL